MFGIEKPRVRDAFEGEILVNLEDLVGNKSFVNKESLEKECLYYSADMCLEFYDKSGGFLPNDWRDHILGEVCAVFDKHFSGKYDKGYYKFMLICLMTNLNNAGQEVANYYNRF